MVDMVMSFTRGRYYDTYFQGSWQEGKLYIYDPCDAVPIEIIDNPGDDLPRLQEKWLNEMPDGFAEDIDYPKIMPKYR